MSAEQEKIDIQMMRVALKEAFKAYSIGEVPVGAALVDQHGELIVSTANNCIEKNDPVGHAEIRLLRRAAKITGNYRLPGTTVYITLEPCAMCAAALVHARVKRVVFGASDPKAGAIESKYRIGNDGRLNHSFEVSSGILGEECSKILVDFFREKR